MPAPDHTAVVSLQEERVPENLAEVGFYSTTQEGFNHSLVVLALGYVCWLMPSGSGYRLLVEASKEARVQGELGKYDLESAGWPPQVAPENPASARLDWVTPMIWALAVLAVFRGQLHFPQWVEAGALDAGAIFGRGEVWRGFTALFLHKDAAHLWANLLSGVCFFAVVLAVFGRSRGWLLLGFAAVVGNLTVAALHYPGPYRSLGASTAIFAALGLLTGRAVRIALGTRHPHRRRALFVPFAAGLVVLALYGAGGPSVDVLAHVAGFGAGSILGFMTNRSAANVSGIRRAM